MIDDDMNTKIIVNNIVSWAKLVDSALANMECQLKVCQAYRSSFNLCKSHIFPKRFKFVGIDVCAGRNCPAQSKHTLLKTWPTPKNSPQHCKVHRLCAVLLTIYSKL
jgi:hypothetical protein